MINFTKGKEELPAGTGADIGSDEGRELTREK